MRNSWIIDLICKNQLINEQFAHDKRAIRNIMTHSYKHISKCGSRGSLFDDVIRVYECSECGAQIGVCRGATIRYSFRNLTFLGKDYMWSWSHAPNVRQCASVVMEGALK